MCVGWEGSNFSWEACCDPRAPHSLWCVFMSASSAPRPLMSLAYAHLCVSSIGHRLVARCSVNLLNRCKMVRAMTHHILPHSSPNPLVLFSHETEAVESTLLRLEAGGSLAYCQQREQQP